MNFRSTLSLFTLAALSVVATACAANVDGTGTTSSAVDPTSSATTGGSRPPPLAFARVIDARTIGDSSEKPADFVLPFLLPPPPKAGDDATPPSKCVVLRPKSGDVAPPMDAPKDPPPDAPPPPSGDALGGPIVVQIAILAADADATPGPDAKPPIAVAQCIGTPDAPPLAVPSDVLSDLLAGVPDGATARIAIAGFPALPKAPPPAPSSTDAPPPMPPMGRGIFTVVGADASSIADAASKLSLPKP